MHNKPIFKNGDLYQIIQVIDEEVNANSEEKFLDRFKICEPPLLLRGMSNSVALVGVSAILTGIVFSIAASASAIFSPIGIALIITGVVMAIAGHIASRISHNPSIWYDKMLVIIIP